MLKEAEGAVELSIAGMRKFTVGAQANTAKQSCHRMMMSRGEEFKEKSGRSFAIPSSQHSVVLAASYPADLLHSR